MLSASPAKVRVQSLAAAPAPVAQPIAKLHKLPGVGGKKTHTSPNGTVTTSYAGSNTPFGKTPSQVRGAYGLGVYGSSPITFAGIQGDGTGQTIAIVDAYDYPTAYNDVNAFSSQFGLPSLISNTTSLANINNAAGPTFTKLSQSGSFSSFPATDPSGPYSTSGGGSWEQEAALDVQWAHAMAPKANIVLVEASSSSFSNMVGTAVNYARTIPGVVAISMSFGANEFSGETTYDQYFATPLNHVGGSATAGGAGIVGGITFVASAGDWGAYAAGTSTITPQYPAASPAVVSIGGTNLVTSGNTYVSETAWGNGASSGTSGGGGGGISTYEGRPSYQANTTSAFSTTNRAYPDVAMLADPNTGVPIYDSWDFGASTPWSPGYFGGTSLAAPLTAGVTAVVDQGRAIEGLGSLSGMPATLPRLYQLSSSSFHDITGGNNGYAAQAGYDLTTGRGTPNGSTFVNNLAGGSASGSVFVDTNGDSTFNGTDTAQSGVTVYLDVNANGAYDASIDIGTTTNASGTFSFADVPGGLSIREVIPSGYVSSSITGGVAGLSTYGALSGLALGNFPTTLTLPAGTNNMIVRVDAGNTRLQFFQNVSTSGTPTYSVLQSVITSLTINGNTGDDTLTLDLTNGNPTASKTLTFNASSQTTADKVAVIANAGGTGGSYSISQVSLLNLTVNFSNVEATSFAGGAGNDTMGVFGAITPTFTGGGGSDTVNANFAQFFPVTDLGAGGASVTLNVGNTSTVNFGVSQHLAAFNISGTSTSALGTSSPLVVRTSALSISSDSSFDPGYGGLVLDYTTTSPDSTVNGLLATGYAAGLWNGKGIKSSNAAGDSAKKHAVGAAEASAALGLSGSATGTFLGELVDATTLLVRYTLYGDSNLDATVNFNDFLILQNNFGTAAVGFGRGNYNYDSTTDFNDFLMLQNNFGLIA